MRRGLVGVPSSKVLQEFLNLVERDHEGLLRCPPHDLLDGVPGVEGLASEPGVPSKSRMLGEALAELGLVVDPLKVDPDHFEGAGPSFQLLEEAGLPYAAGPFEQELVPLPGPVLESGEVLLTAEKGRVQSVSHTTYLNDNLAKCVLPLFLMRRPYPFRSDPTRHAAGLPL